MIDEKTIKVEETIKKSLISNDISTTIKILKDENIDINDVKLDNKKIISWLLSNLSELNEETISNFKNTIIELHNAGLNLNQKEIGLEETPWFLEVLILQDSELSRQFLQASNPEDRPWKSYQALLYACQDGSPFTTLTDLIKDKNIDVEDVNDQEENAMFFAATQTDKYAEQRIFTLLHKGLDPNKKNKMGETPLFYSVNHGTVKATKMLLTGNADPNVVDLDGNTPLNTINIKEGLLEEEIEKIKNQVVLLIESGAKIDLKNNQGVSPMDKECFQDWLKWMVPLVEKTKMETELKSDFNKLLHTSSTRKSFKVN